MSAASLDEEWNAILDDIRLTLPVGELVENLVLAALPHEPSMPAAIVAIEHGISVELAEFVVNVAKVRARRLWTSL